MKGCAIIRHHSSGRHAAAAAASDGHTALQLEAEAHHVEAETHRVASNQNDWVSAA